MPTVTPPWNRRGFRSEREAALAFSDTESVVYRPCGGPCGGDPSKCPAPQACAITPYDVETKRPFVAFCFAAAVIVASIAASALIPWGWA